MRYAVHELAASQPAMDDKAFAELVADIKANGLKVPIVLFDDAILDGRHRAKACAALGIEPTFTRFAGTMREASAFVHSMNVERRHLTPAQKRELALAEVRRDPTQSDRAIAMKVGLDHKTIASTRAASSGEIPHERKTTVRHPKTGNEFERRVVLPAGKKSRDERIAEIRSHAAEGMNLSQIATAIGLSKEATGSLARAAGITFVDHHTRHINVERVVEQTANTLSGLSQGIDTIRRAPIDIAVGKARELHEEIKTALRNVLWLRDQLRKVAQ